MDHQGANAPKRKTEEEEIIATCKVKLIKKILEPKINNDNEWKTRANREWKKIRSGNNFSNKWRRQVWLGDADGNAGELLGRPPEGEKQQLEKGKGSMLPREYGMYFVLNVRSAQSLQKSRNHLKTLVPEC